MSAVSNLGMRFYFCLWTYLPLATRQTTCNQSALKCLCWVEPHNMLMFLIDSNNKILTYLMVDYDTLLLKYRQPFHVTGKLHNQSTSLLKVYQPCIHHRILITKMVIEELNNHLFLPKLQ